MNRPPISDTQMDLLAQRLGAAGVGRREFLKVAAGLAALGAAGFNARPAAAAAPKLAPGEKLAREQHIRIGGGGWWQNDPSSHDYNKDLYCAGVPALWAGLMKFDVNFQPVPYVAEKVASNADGSVWTFKLRQGVKFHSGKTMTADDVVQRPTSIAFSVLPAGTASSMPYELLKAPRLAALIDELRRRYDYVVVDTPSALPFPDVGILRDLVDGFIVVVRANRTPREQLQDTMAVLGRQRTIGLVFNDDDRTGVPAFKEQGDAGWRRLVPRPLGVARG